MDTSKLHVAESKLTNLFLAITFSRHIFILAATFSTEQASKSESVQCYILEQQIFGSWWFYNMKFIIMVNELNICVLELIYTLTTAHFTEIQLDEFDNTELAHLKPASLSVCLLLILVISVIP